MEKQLCIVLRAVDYKDYDRILTLFSRSEGKLNAQARGVRRLKSKLTTASQPFCCAEYEFYQKNDKLYVTNALIRQEYYRIQNDYDRFTAACVMLELTEKMLQHTDDYDRLFVVLINTLYAMETGAADESSALSYFMAQAVDLMGIFPATTFCSVCGAPIPSASHWSARDGGAVCSGCASAAGAGKIDPRLPEYCASLRELPPKNLSSIRIPPEALSALIRLLHEYVCIHTDFKLRTMRCFTQK